MIKNDKVADYRCRCIRFQKLIRLLQKH
uniref:Uncharacterized protein n=1 Tax=Arundo donax TaxID=35708 RepID=A0A0A8ZPS5_ARUDO